MAWLAINQKQKNSGGRMHPIDLFADPSLGTVLKVLKIVAT